jgi:hypothetical protein
VRISDPGGNETLASTALFSFIGAEPASEWLSGFAALDMPDPTRDRMGAS